MMRGSLDLQMENYFYAITSCCAECGDSTETKPIQNNRVICLDCFKDRVCDRLQELMDAIVGLEVIAGP